MEGWIVSDGVTWRAGTARQRDLASAQRTYPYPIPAPAPYDYLYHPGIHGESVLHLLLLMCEVEPDVGAGLRTDGMACSNRTALCSSERRACVYRHTFEWLLRAHENPTPAPQPAHVSPIDDPPSSSQVGPAGDGSYLAAHEALTEPEMVQLVNARYQGGVWRGRTPLHIASARGDVRAVELLLSRGAAVDAPCESGECWRLGGTPLSFAVACGKQAVVERLVAAGAQLTASIDGVWNERDPWDWGSWQDEHFVALDDDTSIATSTLHWQQASWGAWGTSPSSSHALPGVDAKTSRYSGAGLSGRSHVVYPRGNRPLHCAVWSGRRAVFQQLISMGASPFVRNDAGQTPLHMAAALGSSEMFSMVLDAVSLYDWATPPLEQRARGAAKQQSGRAIAMGRVCRRCPLHEIDPLFRYSDGVERVVMSLEDGLSHSSGLLTNGGHETTLETLVRCGRGAHLATPQIAQLLNDKWRAVGQPLIYWELSIAILSLLLLLIATASDPGTLPPIKRNATLMHLSNITTGTGNESLINISGEGRVGSFLDGSAAGATHHPGRLECTVDGYRQAEALAEWDLWTERLADATGDSGFLCYVAVLVLSAVVAGERLRQWWTLIYHPPAPPAATLLVLAERTSSTRPHVSDSPRVSWLVHVYHGITELYRYFCRSCFMSGAIYGWFLLFSLTLHPRISPVVRMLPTCSNLFAPSPSTPAYAHTTACFLFHPDPAASPRWKSSPTIAMLLPQ